jgi:hypothetical protein
MYLITFDVNCFIVTDIYSSLGGQGDDNASSENHKQVRKQNTTL